jgi:Tfp pilus assembly protein PilF
MTQKPAATALVSATLAQVYIQQDHLEQARRMLARVLQADP